MFVSVLVMNNLMWNLIAVRNHELVCVVCLYDHRFDEKELGMCCMGLYLGF